MRFQLTGANLLGSACDIPKIHGVEIQGGFPGDAFIIIGLGNDLEVTGHFEMASSVIQSGGVNKPKLNITNGSGGLASFTWTGGEIRCPVNIGYSLAPGNKAVVAGNVTLNDEMLNYGSFSWDSGNFNFSGAGVFTNRYQCAVNSGGISGALHPQGLIRNEGWMKFAVASTRIVSPQFINDGTLLVTGNVAFENGAKQVSGITTVEAGSTLAVKAGAARGTYEVRAGVAAGRGTYDANVQLGVPAAPAPAAPPQSSAITPGDDGNGIGTLTITGDLVMANDYACVYAQVDANGVSDVVAVQGSATLDGTATVYVDPTYRPTLGTAVPFMTYASRTGDFDSGAVYPSIQQQIWSDPTLDGWYDFWWLPVNDPEYPQTNSYSIFVFGEYDPS